MKQLRSLARSSLLAAAFLGAAIPASAQWTRVTDLPPTPMYSLWANGDTLIAGGDSTVYVSTDAGTTWSTSEKPATGIVAIEAVLIRNGRLYVGSFGRGVFLSDDRGQTWQEFNQGLVGGVLDSQLDLSDLVVRGDSLYAATLGAGVYVRTLAPAGTWSHFGEVFEPEQASNVNSLVLGGTRLLASAGSNGEVFFRDPGDGEWTVSLLDNVGLIPGAQSQSAAWNGSAWVVGSGVGVFHSVAGESPWTFAGPNLGVLSWTALATQGRRFYVAFDRPLAAFMESSDDDGATWQLMESLPGVFVFKLAVSGNALYAARVDGLWRRETATVAVAGPTARGGLQFAVVGAQPVGDQVRFRFELPEPDEASIEVFNVAGRRVAEVAREPFTAGVHEVSWSARALDPGVYAARLTAGTSRRVVRVVRVR